MAKWLIIQQMLISCRNVVKILTIRVSLLYLQLPISTDNVDSRIKVLCRYCVIILTPYGDHLIQPLALGELALGEKERKNYVDRRNAFN